MVLRRLSQQAKGIGGQLLGWNRHTAVGQPAGQWLCLFWMELDDSKNIEC